MTRFLNRIAWWALELGSREIEYQPGRLLMRFDTIRAASNAALELRLRFTTYTFGVDGNGILLAKPSILHEAQSKDYER